MVQIGGVCYTKRTFLTRRLLIKPQGHSAPALAIAAEKAEGTVEVTAGELRGASVVAEGDYETNFYLACQTSIKPKPLFVDVQSSQFSFQFCTFKM